jgi:T-complex protein 1 subunit theta
MGLHPSEILIGYEKAAKLVYKDLENQTCYNLKDIKNNEEVFRCMKTAIASKQFGIADQLGELITKAAYTLSLLSPRSSMLIISAFKRFLVVASMTLR